MGALRRSPTPWGRAARGDHPMASMCPMTTQGGCLVPPHRAARTGAPLTAPALLRVVPRQQKPTSWPRKAAACSLSLSKSTTTCSCGDSTGLRARSGHLQHPPTTPRPHRTTAVPLSSARLRRRRPISVTLAKSPRARSSRSSACPVAPEAPSTKQDPAPLPPPPVAAMSEGSAVLQAVPCRAVLCCRLLSPPGRAQCSSPLCCRDPGLQSAGSVMFMSCLAWKCPRGWPQLLGSPCPPAVRCGHGKGAWRGLWPTRLQTLQKPWGLVRTAKLRVARGGKEQPCPQGRR